ncbi:type II secretion system protein [Motiliproteus coralliicola]|uniref:Type II secretion system protein n=1 Tax=Motiliproteus coralliicola TaxID=2283196 RepID=A0A369WAG8_9GAMM|nr:type II secretion system protein [Motiliproteus coralliicola]RDE18303.1 type II secretion system protein [Motiliproteus coralliicola]
MHNNSKPNQRGFTLLELIVVVGVLGLITAMATDFMVNQTNQQRFDTTKLRLEQIRYAIIGDSSRSLNGQPVFSGFIADTGRVPTQLRQLVSNAEYCTTDITKTTKTDCGSDDWYEASDNWKGPYLPITDLNESFTDGWGNNTNYDDSTVTPDPYNFGWFVSAATGSDIEIISLGMNGASGASSSNTMDRSYEDNPSNKRVIYSNQYAGREVSITITNNSSHDPNLFCFDYIAPGGVSGTTSAATISATDVFGIVQITAVSKMPNLASNCSAATSYTASAAIGSAVVAHNLFTLGAKGLEVTIN